jgi:DNA-binding MarR family transcriptional regulator
VSPDADRPGGAAPSGRDRPSGRDATLDELEHQVAVMIRRVRRRIGERAAAVHPDLHPAAYLILALVADRGPVRQSTIGEVFDLDKGAVSRQVRPLETLGLVSREPDPADGRATLLSVSEHGRRRVEEVAQTRRVRLGERLGSWDDEELRAFVGALARYNASLE